MSNRNRSLAIAVAAVAVVAVAGGGMLAAARGPQNQSGAAAAPLSQAPSMPPSTAPPSTTQPPTTVKVDATKLTMGQGPQVAYVRGRTVMGGIGKPVKVPGSRDIDGAVRLWDETLTLQVDSTPKGTLVVQDSDGKVLREVADIDSLVGSADGDAVAYGSGDRFAAVRQGGTVYYEKPGGPAEKLAQPKSWALDVLSVADKTVFFSSSATPGGVASLYRWTVGQKTATVVPKLTSPLSVSADGTLGASLPVYTDSGVCSAITDLATGLQRWKSCQYRLDRFSPGNAFVIGLPPDTGGPVGVQSLAAVNPKTGKPIRTWTASVISRQLAEDDDHVLLQWYAAEDVRTSSAIVRCTVSTGECELATPLSKEPLLLGS
ncbi:hypothetical protein OG474_19670 [Kribbella sp. NBC_01505]|uniref:hypothetical protein n=1 Tax=Kribbella sp. NBC_01505 TaxID=2903580 RepID=UPI00386EB110